MSHLPKTKGFHRDCASGPYQEPECSWVFLRTSHTIHTTTHWPPSPALHLVCRLSVARRLASFPVPLWKDWINWRKEAKGAPVTATSVEWGQNRWHNLASAGTSSLWLYSHVHTRPNSVRENIQRWPPPASRITQTHKPHEYKPLIFNSFHLLIQNSLF